MITSAQVEKVCRLLHGWDSRPNLSLKQYLDAIPKLDSLSDLPAGTPVLIRGDVDAKPGKSIGEGDVRLRSMIETLEFGRKRQWRQVIFGHIGRKPEGSLEKVAARFSDLLKTEVQLIRNWFDESTAKVTKEAQAAIQNLSPGSVAVLENARAYAIETVLWKVKESEISQHTGKLASLANSLAEGVASVYINEALSAGSLDSSSTVVPLAMKRVALGKYLEKEFYGPMMKCIQAQLVVFSGIKIDKLDDLSAMMSRGTITHVLSAGSLAMALKKASAQLDGKDFHLGVSEDPSKSAEAFYIPPERIEQAKRMIQEGRAKGIEFILPIDLTLADGSTSETIGPGNQQFDIGPKTQAHFSAKIGEFIDSSKKREGTTIAFHNGVFGMFEDPRFESGTKSFIAQLKRMKDSGIEVYVGGGEGGTALERYGQPDWVTHCFTAGGTVLNALGSEPIPYLLALSQVGKH